MRKESPNSKSLSGDPVKVSARHWEDLDRKDFERLCENALAKVHPPEGLVLTFLGREVLVDRVDRCLKKFENGEWERVNYPLLELLFLVYLLNVGPDLLSHEMISVKELKDSHFFQGPHELKIRPVLDRYGHDLKGFMKAAESLGGEAQDLADAAYRFSTFPKVPLWYLFWEGDEEFEPRLSVIFDRSVEKHLSADAIWGLVTLVSTALLRAPDVPFWIED